MAAEPPPPSAGIPPPHTSKVFWAVGVAVFAVLGFAAYYGVLRTDTEKVLKLRVNAMKFFALAYSGYEYEHKRPPTSFAEVLQADPKLPQVLKDGIETGRLTVRWGSRLDVAPAESEPGVLAALTDPVLENTVVILANAFEFRTVTREEYEALPDPKPALPPP